MSPRRGRTTSLARSYGTGWREALGRVPERARRALAIRSPTAADIFDRARGLGCPSGDMRLAYGWRRTVVRTALVAGLVGLGSRVALTGLFVRFVTDGIVPVTGFNVAVTVLGTVTLGLVHGRYIPRSVSRCSVGLVPWPSDGRALLYRHRGRSGRLRNSIGRRRYPRNHLAARYRRALRCGFGRVDTVVRSAHRRFQVLARCRRVVGSISRRVLH